MDQMTEPVGKNLLVAAAIRAAIDHAQRYGDLETAADLMFILDVCIKQPGHSAPERNRFTHPAQIST
jgi:hypothetical protein